MENEIDLTIMRREQDVWILIDSERAESLFETFRQHGISSTYPKGAVFKPLYIRRTRDGRIEREDRPLLSEIELSDHENAVEGIVERWLQEQK